MEKKIVNPCDSRTAAWFARQPSWMVTTLAQCECCGLWYKPDLGHECEKNCSEKGD